MKSIFHVFLNLKSIIYITVIEQIIICDLSNYICIWCGSFQILMGQNASEIGHSTYPLCCQLPCWNNLYQSWIPCCHMFSISSLLLLGAVPSGILAIMNQTQKQILVAFFLQSSIQLCSYCFIAGNKFLSYSATWDFIWT